MPDTQVQDLPGKPRESFLKPCKVLIIVPAFNEQENIKKTVEEIFASDPLLSILVVNDGSKDRTVEEAKQTRAWVVSLPFNLGIGGAVQTGFKFACEHAYDVAIQVDGDGQHIASYIKNLLPPVLDNTADMTIGSRFLPPYIGYRSSFIRRIGIHFFAHLISWLTDCKITDPTSGFRAYNKKMIRFFARYYPSDFPEPEAIVVARRHNARIQEVAVQMRKRAHGHSSIRYLYTLYYMIKVTFAVVLDKVKERKDVL